MVSWLPLYHDMGLIGAWLGCLYYGAPFYVMSPLLSLRARKAGYGPSIAFAERFRRGQISHSNCVSIRSQTQI